MYLEERDEENKEKGLLNICDKYVICASGAARTKEVNGEQRYSSDEAEGVSL